MFCLLISGDDFNVVSLLKDFKIKGNNYGYCKSHKVTTKSLFPWKSALVYLLYFTADLLLLFCYNFYFGVIFFFIFLPC